VDSTDTLDLPDLAFAEALEQWALGASVALALIDAEHRFLRVNETLAAIDGVPSAAHVGRSLAELLPELDAEMGPLLDRVLHGGEPVTDVLITGAAPAEPARERRWNGSCYPLRARDGSVRAVAAIVVEVTDERQASALRISEERLSLALEGTQTGSWQWDIAADRITWSENLGPLHGLPRGAQPGDYEEYQRHIHPADRAALDAAVRRAVGEGIGYDIEFRVNTPDSPERWLWARAHVIRDLQEGKPAILVGLTTDITERKREEDERAFLASTAEALGGVRDPYEALTMIAAAAVPRLADWCVVQLVDREGTLEDVAVTHTDPLKVRWARELQTRFPPDPDAVIGAPEVVRTGRSELYPEVTDDMLVAGAQSPEHLELLRELRISSAMLVPLAARGRRLGAITFVFAESGRRYGDRELALAEELGRRAGLALDHARLFEREHRAAETLQRALLPDSLPSIPDHQLTVRYLPGAEGTEVGGDWYDAFALPDGRFGLAIGDIVGRGIPAAAMMGQVRTALRAYAIYAAQPAEVVDRLYGMTEAFGDVPFATLMYLVLDPATGEGCYASAGHLPPLVIPAAGRAAYAGSLGTPPLGSMQPATSPQAGIQLERGATLLLFSDGLVEDPPRPLDDGLDALAAAATAPSGELEALADGIIARMSGDRSRPDDIALLALRRT